MSRPFTFLTASLLAALLVALGINGCTEQRFPGEQIMGTFAFTATPLTQGCTFTEQPGDAGFPFEATFSRRADNSHVWMTLQGVNRDAQFDGQYLESTQEAPRRFAQCNCDNTVVKETLRVALLSQSQFERVQDGGLRNPDGGACPPNALDAGLPGEAEGAALPSPQDDGRAFDAVTACGVLVDEVLPGEGCECAACTLSYELVGVSR